MRAPAHLVLAGIIVIWDIVLAGRIAQNDQAERPLQVMCGFAALLLLPALLLKLATSTLLTSRAVASMDWLWPAVLILFAAQSVYALMRGLVPGELINADVRPHVARFGLPRFLFALGLPIAAYDVLIAGIGVIRFLVAHGHGTAEPFVAFLGAQSLAMVVAGGTPGVLSTPLFLNVPIISPAFPALHKLTAPFRLVVSIYGLAWVLLIMFIGLPHAVQQLQVYSAHSRDQLRERPNGDFAIGLKILPDLSGPPPAAAVRADSALADTMEVDAVTVVVEPGIGRAALDSISRVLDPARRDSATIIVAIGYNTSLVPELEVQPLDEAKRLITVRRVEERLHPDILLPAEDPYRAGSRAVGPLQPARWESYLIDAVRTAKAVDPRVRIGVSASDYRHGDSVLYAWAARARSPIDLLGFSFFPSPYVGGDIQSDTRTAARWMAATPSRKDHWIFATGGYPLAYGEKSQADAIWQVLAWATDHPTFKGAVIYEAGDYGQARGLRAPDGRYRAAAGVVMRALTGLRESIR